MTKVVINSCYGGFGISPAAREAYLARKGKLAFHYTHARKADGGIDFDSYQRLTSESADWLVTTVIEDQGDKPTSEAVYDDEVYFDYRELERSDPDLVAVVEELGEAANGDHAELKVVEVPDDVKWEISEYDGIEWVAEKHRRWSFMAKREQPLPPKTENSVWKFRFRAGELVRNEAIWALTTTATDLGLGVRTEEVVSPVESIYRLTIRGRSETLNSYRDTVSNWLEQVAA